MHTRLQNWPLTLSRKLYQYLLTAYPRAHRQAYGGAMLQLFRDQCRDAWHDRRGLGLAALWLRILPDLIKTSCFERFATLNPRKFMSDNFPTFLRPRSPMSVFLIVFMVVFLLVFSLGVVITFLLPESYASTARIKVESDGDYNVPGQPASGEAFDPFFVQTTFEIIQSQLVLSNAISALNLNVIWGKRYFAGQPLRTAETMELLKRRMTLQPVRGTKLVAITVYSENKNECADIANAIAASYQAYRMNLRQQLMAGSLKALENRAADIDARIHASQTKLDYLRAQLNVSDNGPDSLSPASPTNSLTQKYEQQLAEADRSYPQMQAQWDKLKSADRQKLREILPTVTPDSQLLELVGKLRDAEQTLATLTNDYLPGNAHLVRIQSLITELTGEIDARVDGIMAGLESEVSSRKIALDALVADMAAAKKQDQQEYQQQQPYWEEKRSLNGLQGLQKTTAVKIEEEKLALETPQDLLVQITDRAEPGYAPVKPNKPVNLAISALVGVIIGSPCGTIAALITRRSEKRRTAATSPVV